MIDNRRRTGGRGRGRSRSGSLCLSHVKLRRELGESLFQFGDLGGPGLLLWPRPSRRLRRTRFLQSVTPRYETDGGDCVSSSPNRTQQASPAHSTHLSHLPLSGGPGMHLDLAFAHVVQAVGPLGLRPSKVMYMGKSYGVVEVLRNKKYSSMGTRRNRCLLRSERQTGADHYVSQHIDGNRTYETNV